MRLLLINPCNPLVSTVKSRENSWNKYVVWKPLGLLVLAGLTPDNWDISIIDENLAGADYEKLPPPDLVGITAFTSQAPRAYEIAADFRARNIPVVMGGIHASMCISEAMTQVDAVVKGEAEGVWGQVLRDCCNGTLKRLYEGVRPDLGGVPAARHDLLSNGYRIGSIQTSRGCPLACSFCSVTAFNGGKFRRRPVEKVIQEFRIIPEKYVLIVDDNLIGTRKNHIEYTKTLFREMIAAKLRKRWIAQVTINMADDEELLTLARKAGCTGVFIGFESVSAEGLSEVSKKFNMAHNRDMRNSVRRIQKHGITVMGSFILGLDIDGKGSGKKIALTARLYGLDILNVMLLTPLPGTKLWETMEADNRLIAGTFPGDWKYFTLTLPVARHQKLSRKEIEAERESCYRNFYSYPAIVRRLIRSMKYRGKAALVLVSNLVLRKNTLYLDRITYADFDLAMEKASGRGRLRVHQRNDCPARVSKADNRYR